jgi:hypothetical protein
MSSRAKHPNRCARFWAQQQFRRESKDLRLHAPTTAGRTTQLEPPRPVSKTANVIQSEPSESLRPPLGATTIQTRVEGPAVRSPPPYVPETTVRATDTDLIAIQGCAAEARIPIAERIRGPDEQLEWLSSTPAIADAIKERREILLPGGNRAFDYLFSVIEVYGI